MWMGEMRREGCEEGEYEEEGKGMSVVWGGGEFGTL